MPPEESQTTTVTVVITAYHREQYLNGAIRSATSEQDDPPEEVLVLTQSRDGSRVNGEWIGADTLETIGGMFGYAIAHARGDVIAFLDDDDTFSSHKIRYVRTMFSRDPSLTLLRNEMHNFGQVPQKHWPVLPPSYGLVSHRLAPLFRSQAGINSSSISIRRKALLPYAEALSHIAASPDYALVWAALAQGGGIMSVPNVLTERRLHGKNTSLQPTEKVKNDQTMSALVSRANGIAHKFARSFIRFNRPATIAAVWDGVECLSWPRLRRAAAAHARSAVLRVGGHTVPPSEW